MRKAISCGKKFAALLLAVMIITALPYAACAAPSPHGSSTSNGITMTSSNGNLYMRYTYRTEDEKKAAEDIAANPITTLASIAGADAAEGMRLVVVADVAYNGDESKLDFPVTVTFHVPGVKDSSKVYVLVYRDGKWVSIPATVQDGTVTVSLDSIGPIAIYLDKESAVSQNGDADSADVPKTGDCAPVAAVFVIMLAALFGVVFTVRVRRRG